MNYYRVIDSKLTLRGRSEIEIQQEAPFWNAGRLSFSLPKELAPGDASISRYGRFELGSQINAFGENTPSAKILKIY